VKLATFLRADDGTPRLGAVVDGDRSVIDLSAEHIRRHGAAASELRSMQDLVESGPRGLDLARAAAGQSDAEFLPLADVRLLAPLPLPVQIRDCMCFEGHLVGSMEAAARMSGGAASPRQLAMHEVFKQRPIYYKANRFATAGTDTDVHWPPYSKLMDYELEMGCVLGRTGKNITKGEAPGYIFGFTIFNDFSARDTQRAEMECGLGPSKSKDFDNANVFGPWIVTADEFDPYNAEMTVRINGDVRSIGHSSSMNYKFEDLISFISQSETLHTGEILCSGTVGGGCGFEQGRLLESGDVVELEIAGIGRIRNRIVT
jgi:2-keto-4-pentenoate hydratase/2-oxohepta-3-ene-1,7-dioic acid hydratase in catechol pathway